MPRIDRMQHSEFKSRLAAADHEIGGSATSELPYEPELDDLYYLYSMVRDTAAVSVLEFGSGWSTLAFALALDENRQAMSDRYKVRHPNPFRLMTVEVSDEWMSVTLARIPSNILGLVVPQVTQSRLAEYDGQIVSLYERLPFFVPDLIYLDGPDPSQVTGEVDGFTSTELHGLPMAGDLLRLEPHFWPWTVIVTDGRRGNARMLEANLRRNWQVLHDPFGDHTLFRLDETPFGAVSESHIALRLDTARVTRMKDAPVAG